MSEPITHEAHRLVSGDRGNIYGPPHEDWGRVAKMWEGIFGHEVTPEQVALAQICVKISRLVESPNHRDSLVDIAGYATGYDEVRRWRHERRAADHPD